MKKKDQKNYNNQELKISKPERQRIIEFILSYYLDPSAFNSTNHNMKLDVISDPNITYVDTDKARYKIYLDTEGICIKKFSSNCCAVI